MIGPSKTAARRTQGRVLKHHGVSEDGSWKVRRRRKPSDEGASLRGGENLALRHSKRGHEVICRAKPTVLSRRSFLAQIALHPLGAPASRGRSNSPDDGAPNDCDGRDRHPHPVFSGHRRFLARRGPRQRRVAMRCWPANTWFATFASERKVQTVSSHGGRTVAFDVAGAPGEGATAASAVRCLGRRGTIIFCQLPLLCKVAAS